MFPKKLHTPDNQSQCLKRFFSTEISEEPAANFPGRVCPHFLFLSLITVCWMREAIRDGTRPDLFLFHSPLPTPTATPNHPGLQASNSCQLLWQSRTFSLGTAVFLVVMDTVFYMWQAFTYFSVEVEWKPGRFSSVWQIKALLLG